MVFSITEFCQELHIRGLGHINLPCHFSCCVMACQSSDHICLIFSHKKHSDRAELLLRIFLVLGDSSVVCSVADDALFWALFSLLLLNIKQLLW